MASAREQERPWPPVYDEVALEATIQRVSSVVADRRLKQFYLSDFGLELGDPQPNQGDVLALPAGVPVIDPDGDVAEDDRVNHWLVVANSCDVQRTYDTSDVEFVSIAAMYPGESLDVFNDENFSRALHLYRLTRMFLMPSWDGATVDHIADFTRIVPVHRDALHSAQIVARLQMDTWALLNACLVRMFCRTDDRYGLLA